MAKYDMYEMIKPNSNPKKIKIKRLSKKLFISILVIISIAVLCAVYWFYFMKPSIENAKESKAISSIIKKVKIERTEENKDKTDMQLKVSELQKNYANVVAWIRIDNTNIDYPVMQTTDNNYYLTHSYNNEKSKLGSIYMNKKVDVNLPSTNFVVYGHNITTGVMFNELLNYRNKDYYNEHKIIKFVTPNLDREYEIISVFMSRIFYENEENAFRYYSFINATNEAEYNEFVRRAKESSIYDTGVTAKYGDQLLTLITCEYSSDNGRMVVIAREKK